MQRHLRRCAIASSGRDSAKLVLHDLNLELEKAGITARGGSIVDATFTWALKLHKEQGPCARPLKRTSPRKGEPGVSDTRRISAWMPQGALCMVWRRSPRMYPTYPVAHTLVREDDRFCYADFRLYRYSEAPLRTQQTHTSHLYAKALQGSLRPERALPVRSHPRKASSPEASGRSKVEHPFLTPPKASKCATQRADIGRVRKVV